MEDKVQEVRLAVRISGDYAAWHEISHTIMWDYTNDQEIGYYSKEEVEEALKEGHDQDSDSQMMDGILYKGKYYINL